MQSNIINRLNNGRRNVVTKCCTCLCDSWCPTFYSALFCHHFRVQESFEDMRVNVCLPTHVPIDNHRILAVRRGRGIRVGWLGCHGLDSDETQRACMVFIGIWKDKKAHNLVISKSTSSQGRINQKSVLTDGYRGLLMELLFISRIL